MFRTLITLAGLMIASAAPANAAPCGVALANWSRITSYPANTATRPLNTVAIGADGRLRWNGSVATRADIEQYLRIVPLMKAGNLTILAVGRGADCAQVRAIRAMMDKALTCTPQKCAERK